MLFAQSDVSPVGAGWGELRDGLRRGLRGGGRHILPGAEHGGQHLVGHTLRSQLQNFGRAQVVYLAGARDERDDDIIGHVATPKLQYFRHAR